MDHTDWFSNTEPGLHSRIWTQSPQPPNLFHKALNVTIRVQGPPTGSRQETRLCARRWVGHHVPFMFQVKASRSFCPSISMSSRMGTSTSGWDAFSWITAGSWSSKLEGRQQHAQQGGLGSLHPGPPSLHHWSLWPNQRGNPASYRDLSTMGWVGRDSASRGPC